MPGETVPRAVLESTIDRFSNDGTTQIARKRARRFPVQMSLRYRARGGRQWRSGITQNISYSGVLFLVECLEEPNTPIEMSLILPVEVFEEPAAELLCEGVVVRAMRSDADRGLPALACTISRYRFVRP